MTIALDDNTGFDEPAQDAAPAGTNDRNALAISQDMARVQNALSEFDRVAAGLAAIEAQYPKDAIYEVGTTKGMKDAVEHRAAWRDPRITVEKARKMAKAPLLALGKSIDARAAWITEKLREGEEPIDQLIKAEEARREEEKQARINAEAGRILAIQEALADISMRVLAACGKTSVEVRALSVEMHETLPDPDVFQEMMPQAKEAWAAGIAKLETTLKAKLWDEAEQARITQERIAEEARRKQEAERLEAQRAEQAAQAERLAAQQRALDEQAAKIAAAQKAIDDAKAEAERAAAEKLMSAAYGSAQERVGHDRTYEVYLQFSGDHGNSVPIGKVSEYIAALETLQPESITPAQDSQQVLKAEAPAPDATDRDAPASTSPSVGSMGAGQAADAAPSGGTVRPIHPAAQALRNEQPTLTLGMLKDRLGFTVTADFLAELGFEATAVKASRLYRKSQFGDICAALVQHIESVRAEVALAA
jgi:hypothetical protein